MKPAVARSLEHASVKPVDAGLSMSGSYISAVG